MPVHIATIKCPECGGAAKAHDIVPSMNHPRVDECIVCGGTGEVEATRDNIVARAYSLVQQLEGLNFNKPARGKWNSITLDGTYLSAVRERVSELQLLEDIYSESFGSNVPF